MDQRISLVTLGTVDLPRAVAFYGALGWSAAAVHDDVAFFQTGCMALAIWDRSAMAADAGLDDNDGFGGIELAQNVGSPEELGDRPQPGVDPRRGRRDLRHLTVNRGGQPP